MSTPFHAELVILGAGAAGYGAAVYAARAELRAVLIASEADERSGKPRRDGLTEPEGLDPEMRSSDDLQRRLREHSGSLCAKVVYDHVHLVNLAKRPFKLHGTRRPYTCDALIIDLDRVNDPQLFEGQLEMSTGRIQTLTGLSGMTTLTSRRGVFVVGEALGLELDAVVTGTGAGCMAALDAQRYLGR